ncbi:hypothetical protein C2S51_021683 [Perilla frutescens var. frutescens]|nr:hypothetical protein C2S51_021683 [Perilla frutescens var. frutescens]
MEELHAKTAELEKMKEELRLAKEDAMQSWLDSRPLIDEFEQMQVKLENTKARVFKGSATIAELQAQLGTTDACIKSAKDEEQNLRMKINDENQNVHKMQEDMEQLKTKMDQKRRRRSKLKLVWRLKRQTLQTLELTSEAVKLESEAFKASTDQALYYINNSEVDNVMMIQLTQEEYEYLKKEANEQISLAEWRISVSAEEKLAAENSRDLAFQRLQSLDPNNRVRHSNMTGQTVQEETVKNEQAYTRAGSTTKHRQVSKGRGKSPTGVSKKNQQWQSNNNNSFRVRKKESIFFRIKTFIVRSLAKYFR